MAITPIDPGITWGEIRTIINNDLSDLDTRKADASELDNYMLRSEFIDESEGVASAGKPVKLDGSGKISPSMLDVSIFYYVGPFTPAADNEYPDTTGESHGAFWVVQGVDSTNGYTFAGGDLTGLTVNNGDFMVWAANGWSIMAGEMNPMLYYKLDGSQPLTGPFAGGGQQIKNIADGTDETDAVTLRQLNSLGTDSFYKLDGSTPLTGPFAGGGQQIKNIADGTDPTDAVTVAQLSNLDLTGFYKLDGTTPLTADFAGGGFQIKNIADGTEDSDAVTVAQLNAIDLSGFYKLDGSRALTADFNGGGFKLTNIADGTEDTDAVTVAQLNAIDLSGFYKLDGSRPLTADFDGGGFRLTNIADGVADTDAATVRQINNITEELSPFQLAATGAAPSGDVLDLNEVKNYSILRPDPTSTNLPAGATEWYIITIPVDSGDGCMQIAVSATSADRPILAYRQFLTDAWTSWEIVPRMRFDSDSGTLYIRDDGTAP